MATASPATGAIQGFGAMARVAADNTARLISDYGGASSVKDLFQYSGPGPGRR